MAALLVVGALALADRVVEKKKEKKRNKKAKDEKRYRELQRETDQRMGAAPFDDEDQLSSEEEIDNLRVAGDEKAPPAYEDAVSAGARREAEWRAQMQRRRSSAQSRRSAAEEAPVRPENLMRMG